jgi:hypothetical protein
MATQISGDTGVSQVQSGVVQQADLAANVVGNGPAFSATMGSAQTLPSATFTKLQLRTEEFDTSGAYDNATNFRFQPTVAGYYNVVGGVAVASSATSIATGVYKNGASYKSGNNVTTNQNTSTVTCLVYLNGITDYIELYAYFATGQAVNTATEETYFQAHLARAA